jgi:hypothetical protein
MRAVLLDANDAVNAAREAGAATLAPQTLAALVERYWAAVRLGLAFHRQLPKLEKKANSRGRAKQRPGHNLLERLKGAVAGVVEIGKRRNLQFVKANQNRR